MGVTGMPARGTFRMILQAIARRVRHALLTVSALEQFDYLAGLPFGFGNVNTSKIVLIATSREPECALGRRLRSCKFDQRFDPTLW
jgi:hypothetical protein